MIGSSINQMVTAEKMSVDQLRQSIENGTVEAYIGIPLLQAKIKDQQQAQMMQQPAQRPPIAQEVMAQAAGVEQLPTNLPAEQYRDGGIIGLAEGGDFFLDEDDPLLDSQEEEEYVDALSGLFNAAQNIAGMQNMPTKAMSSYQNVTPDVERDSLRAQAPQTAPKGRMQQPQTAGIQELIASAAGQYNLPPELLSNIAGAESAGRADAANPRSSAKGIFQFIDSTWEGLGGTPGNQFDPRENVELGARYTRQNAERLKNELGRNPTYAETYAAHYFGPGVTSMIKNADPSDPIEVGLGTFTSARGVDQILKANPNLQGKTVGEVMSSLEQKAGEGIVELARGGAVRFDNGGDTSSPFMRWLKDQQMLATSINPTGFEQILPQSYWEEQAKKPTSELLKESIVGPFMSQTDEEYAARRQAQGQALEEGMRSPEMLSAQQKLADYDMGFGLGSVGSNVGTFTDNIAAEVAKSNVGRTKPEETPKPLPKETPKPAPEVKKTDLTAPVDKGTSEDITKVLKKEEPAPKKAEDFYDLFMQDYMSSKSDKDRQAKMDAYMALATAGFAAAAGTSPNALQNIAQGALAGVGQYAGTQKTRAAEDIAEQKNLLTAQRYKELGEAARATSAMTEIRLTAEEQYRMNESLRKIKQGYEESLQNDTSMIGKTPIEKEAIIQQLLARDPQYNESFKSLYGVNYNQYLQQQSGQTQNNFAGYSAKPK